MTHAAVAMVDRLRGRSGAFGLLYGQGEFMTKHYGLILSSTAPSWAQFHLPRSVQARTESDRATVRVDPDFTGAATLETFTVIFSQDGEPARAAVIARTASGLRTIAAVPVADRSAIDRLPSLDRSPVGRAGAVALDGAGKRQWNF